MNPTSLNILGMLTFLEVLLMNYLNQQLTIPLNLNFSQNQREQADQDKNAKV